jgi:hypothetical protein
MLERDRLGVRGGVVLIGCAGIIELDRCRLTPRASGKAERGCKDTSGGRRNRLGICASSQKDLSK